MAPAALFILSVLAHLVVLHSAEDPKEETSKLCPARFCWDKGVNISLFKGEEDLPDCGLFRVDCSKPERPKVQLKERGYWHEFQGNLSTSVVINDKDFGGYRHEFRPTLVFINDTELAGRLEKDRCNDRVLEDLSLPSASPKPDLVLFAHNLTLLKCNTTLDNNSYPRLKDVGCGNASRTYYYIASKGSLPSPRPPGCAPIQVPMRPNQPKAFSSLTAEFKLQVGPPQCLQCYEREGECLVEEDGKIKCTKGDKQSKLKLGLGLGKIDISAFKYIINMDTHLGQALEPKDGNQSFPNASGFIF